MLDQEFASGKENNEIKLEAQVDTLPWSELVRHFAFGRLYVVRSPWNLLEAAEVIKTDDATRLKMAMASSEFGLPTEAEVSLWHADQQMFEVLVLSPFVLVAPLNPAG